MGKKGENIVSVQMTYLIVILVILLIFVVAFIIFKNMGSSWQWGLK